MTGELGKSIESFWTSSPREILLRIDRFIKIKYGPSKKYKGKEIVVGGKKYVQYQTLADLQQDFPGIGGET